MTDNIPNPYVGPRPFERQDSARFFGRDQEARELLSLVVANRAVVLYAQSGAGKTSLLNAQVVPLLEAEGFEVWPVARVQGPTVNGIDLAEIGNIYAFYALFSWAGHEGETAVWSHQTIPAYLQTYPHAQDESGYDQPRVLIFDQLEELFTAYPARWQEREGFLNQIARALDNDPLLRVVFSLREDYVAQLDPYAHLLPRNLGVRFRLERMRPEAALAAIRSPLRETERNFAPGVAEQLVEDLRAVRAETPGGGVKTVTGEFVEPVQLQVVCQNLWEDLPPEVTTITAEHLRQFGDVDQALSNFYTRAVNRALPLAGMDEEALRQWFETSLITPAGTRGTVYRGVQETAGVDNTAVQILEDMHIIRGEIRAGSRWVELTHDRLIEPIQQANRQWHDARQAARIKRIRQIAIGIVTIVLIIGLGTPFLSLLLPNNNLVTAAIQATGTGQAEMQAEMNETATAAWGTATAETMIRDTAVAQTAIFQDALNATATTDIIVRDTAVAQTAVYQDSLNATATGEAAMFATALAETAVAQQTLEANLMTAAMEATRTFAELERLRVPVRPLQPGISIGNQTSNTAGTLSAFVVDDDGAFYLLGPTFALGAADAPVWQPSPIDGGQPENAVAFTTRSNPTTGSSTIDAARLIGIARLEPGISFQTTVPGIGPVVGTRPPVMGEGVWVYGRTSGLVERQISCVASCRATIGESVTVNADFALDRPLSSGDEGALVLDGVGYVIGIVAVNTADGALGAGMTAVLDQFDVELVTIGQQVIQYNLGQGVWPVVFSPDGNQLAASDSQGIWLFNLMEPDATPEQWGGYEELVLSLAFSPDGTLLASGGQDDTIRLWNIAVEEAGPVVLQGHTNDVTAIDFTPDGKWLASGSLDGTIRLWPIETSSSEPLLVAQLGHNIYTLSISPDGRWLAIGDGDGKIRIWSLSDLNAGPVILPGHSNIVTSIDFSSDSTQLASAGFDGDVRIWDLNDLENEPTLLAENIGRTVAFANDNQWLAIGGGRGNIRLWNLVDLTAEPLLFAGHTDVVLALSFSPNGIWLASGSNDSSVRLWLVR